MFSEFYGFLKNLSAGTFYGFLTLTDSLSVNIMIILYFVDVQSGKRVFQLKLPLKDIKKFIDELGMHKNVLQAVIIDIFEIDVQDTGFKSRYEFRTAFKEKLNKLQIPNYFMLVGNMRREIFLTAADIHLQYNETLLFILNTSESCTATHLQFTENGYKYIGIKELKPNICRTQFFGEFNPTKIILFENNENESIKEFLNSEKLTVMNGEIMDYLENFIVQKCKWILDNSNVKYHIMPEYIKNVKLDCYYGKKCSSAVLYKLDVDHYNKLPFSKSTCIPRTVTGCSISFPDDKDAITFDPDFDRKCHRFKVTLSVDAETMESCKIEKVIVDSIRKLPYMLDNLSEPVIIGLFDNSSVILVHDDYIGYDFLQSWNGIYGKDLFMSFDQKKPKYFDEAWKKLEDKPSFVVFDLLRIMSMPSDQIQISDAWGFTTTKDANNPVLLEFDNFDGTRKAASPSFLMAVFIRKHLEAIRDENGGEKPNKIAFWILNELNGEKQFNDDQMNRIKEGIDEACKLLNVKCKFVAC